MQASVNAMARLGYLFLRGGNWKGRQIVSQEWVRESTALQVTEQQQADEPYAFFWWLGEINEDPAFAASGSFGQKIYCLPDLDLVVVVASAVDSEGFESLEDSFGPVLDEVVFGPLTS